AAVASLAGYGILATAEFTTPSSHHASLPPVDERAARQAVGTRAVSESGPSDSMQNSAGRGSFYLLCRQRGRWLAEISGHQPLARGWFRAYEPVHNVSADYPPTMLLHGDADTDIDVEQSVQMHRQLGRHGVPNELLRRSEWGHVFLYMPNDPSAVDAFERIA